MRKEWKYLIAGVLLVTFHLTVADGFIIIFPPAAGWIVIYLQVQSIYEADQNSWKNMKLIVGAIVFLTGALEILRLSQVYDYLTEFAGVLTIILELVFFYQFTREYVKRRYISYDAVTGYLVGTIGAVGLLIVGVTFANQSFTTISSVIIVGERLWMMVLLWKSGKYEYEEIEWTAFYQKNEKENTVE